LAVPGLPQPRRIVEWAVDQTRKVRISRWEPQLVTLTLTPSGTGVPIQVQAMRVYLSEVDGEKGEFEMNMVSKQGMVVLNELLARPDVRDLLLEVTRQGAPPKTRWVIRIV